MATPPTARVGNGARACRKGIDPVVLSGRDGNSAAVTARSTADGKMGSRAWTFALVIDGVDSLRTPHGPRSPSNLQLSPPTRYYASARLWAVSMILDRSSVDQAAAVAAGR
jgi:hypothetical protein